MKYYEIKHSGIKGQKWGVRKYQNPDGTLTAEGKVRYRGKYGKVRQQIDNGESPYSAIHRRENKTNARQKLASMGSTVATGLGAALLAAQAPVSIALLPAGVIGIGATAVSHIMSSSKYKDMRLEYGVSESNRANRNYDSVTTSDKNVRLSRNDD